MLTVNDLIGLDYSKLRNPQTLDQPLVTRQPFLNSSYPQPEFFPNDQQGSLNVDMGATGNIPMSANINAQPLIAETSGIAPLLYSDTNMPLDNEEMIQRDSSIITPPKRKIGLENILQLAISAAIPGAGFLMRAPKGLVGLNRRIQQSDFGQATSLTDYLDMQRYGGLQGRLDAAARNMAQARGIQKQMSSRPSGQVTAEDKYRGGASSAGEAASRSAATRSSRTAGIAAARGSNYGRRLHG